MVNDMAMMYDPGAKQQQLFQVIRSIAVGGSDKRRVMAEMRTSVASFVCLRKSLNFGFKVK